MNSKDHFLARHFTCVSDTVFFFCGIIMLASEIWKQLVLTFIVGNGTYIWWYFPFQLCSIPMYIFLVLPFVRPEKIRQALLCFLMCYALLGGIAVFADTSGLHYSYAPLTVHSYLWHFLMIGTALFSGSVYATEQPAGFPDSLDASPAPCPSRRLSLDVFAAATALYLFCCLTATVLNLTLDKYGTINMFYINPDYPMQQIVFRDIAARIGNLPSIVIYIGATISGAFLLFLLWNAVLRILSGITRRRADRKQA